MAQMQKVSNEEKPKSTMLSQVENDEEEIEKDKEANFLQYNADAPEIPNDSFTLSFPYYKRNMSNFFHPKYTTNSLVAHQPDDDFHQHKHHQHHHQGTPTVTVDAGEILSIRNQEIRDILKYCFPNRDFKDENGKCFRQEISTVLPDLSEVKALVVEVESRLERRKAKETGYCPIRRAIFTDVFDEILRQIIIDNPVLGILLYRIQNEVLMTFSCYRFLIQSMHAYGSRKSVQGKIYQDRLEELNNKSIQLIELRKRHSEAALKYQSIQLQYRQKREADARKRKEVIDYLKSNNRLLHHQMERMNAKGGFWTPHHNVDIDHTPATCSNNFLKK